MTEAHTQAVTLHYRMVIPSHDPREHEATKKDFDAIHRRQRPTARCYVGQHIGYAECRDAQGNPAPAPESGPQPGLELHHTHIEDCLANSVSLTAIEVDYPGVSDPSEVGAWVNSAANLRWLCAYHHRGTSGVHVVAHAAWESVNYVPGLIA
jgi:hypothetical protein